MKSIVCAVLSLCLASCSGIAQQSSLDEMRTELTQLQTAMELASRQAQARADARQQYRRESQQADQISTEHLILSLGTELQELDSLVKETCAQKPPPPSSALEQQQCTSTQRIEVSNDKIIVGAVEKVWLDPPGIQITARIDTGAASTSLTAQNITEFERDGVDWVRFDVTLQTGDINIERPVKKYVRVYQQSDKKGTRRAVVDMRIFMGDVHETFEITLADRSHLEHAMILGRNFLADIALVDVGQQFVQPNYQNGAQ